MAKEAKPEASAAEAPPPRRSKKLIIIIAAVLAIVLLIAAAGAFFLMRSHSSEDGEDTEVAAEQASNKNGKTKGAKESAPTYVPLEAFTVNLVPESGEQFVQLVFSVEVSDAQTADKLKTFGPKVRNNVMMLLSGKKASELLTKEGKEALANEIRDQINSIIAPGAKAADGPVREVLFTSFIIQ